jgi:hypothetical protein
MNPMEPPKTIALRSCQRMKKHTVVKTNVESGSNIHSAEYPAWAMIRAVAKNNRAISPIANTSSVHVPADTEVTNATIGVIRPYPPITPTRRSLERDHQLDPVRIVTRTFQEIGDGRVS